MPTCTLDVTGWGTDLDAFNDILRGGFGTPQGGFILRWAISTQRLGWPETIRFTEKKLTTAQAPSSQPAIACSGGTVRASSSTAKASRLDDRACA